MPSRKTFSITDEPAVTEWLEDDHFEMGEHFKLDTTRVKAATVSAMKVNGEIIPGIEANSTEYLTVKAA